MYFIDFLQKKLPGQVIVENDHAISIEGILILLAPDPVKITEKDIKKAAEILNRRGVTTVSPERYAMALKDFKPFSLIVHSYYLGSLNKEFDEYIVLKKVLKAIHKIGGVLNDHHGSLFLYLVSKIQNKDEWIELNRSQIVIDILGWITDKNSINLQPMKKYFCIEKAGNNTRFKLKQEGIDLIESCFNFE